jgi:hypothetical protein
MSDKVECPASGTTYTLVEVQGCVYKNVSIIHNERFALPFIDPRLPLQRKLLGAKNFINVRKSYKGICKIPS